MDPHLHLEPHIRSPTYRCFVPYFADFTIAGSWVGGVEISYPMFCDTHFASKICEIYILTPRLFELPSLIPPMMSPFNHRAILYLANFAPYTIAGSWVLGFHKSIKSYFALIHPHHPPSLPNAHLL